MSGNSRAGVVESRPRRGTRGVRAALRWGPALLLLPQNVAIFACHYFGSCTFPWDFVGSYYAVIAYWTSAVHRGSFPQWVPYQQMGYPLFLNLQSGLFYPPLWLFPLFDIPYTLRMATITQCLHVLLGSFGMYLFLRRVLGPRRYALLGAFAFQLFGGFYSNAEHLDVIRAYALIPWLLYLLTLRASDRPWRDRRLLWVPLVVSLFATGGYAGSLVAALLMAAVYVAAQLVDLALRRKAGALSATGLSCFLLVGLGLLMSTVHLGSAWLFRDLFARYHGYAKEVQCTLSFAHLPGLFLSNKWLPGDLSTTSTYLCIPLLLAAGFVSLPAVRSIRPQLSVALAAAGMVGGNSSPLYRAMTRAFPTLRLSRFPCSDYGIFIAIGILLLGLTGLRRLRRKVPSPTRWLTILGVAAGLFAWGIVRAYEGHWSGRAVTAAAVGFCISAGGLLYWGKSRRGSAVLASSLLLAAMGIDGSRILYEIRQTWRVPDIESYSRFYFPGGADVFRTGRTRSVSPPEPVVWSRGARKETGTGGYRGSGYLIGDYDMADFGGFRLGSRAIIEAEPSYLAFMAKPWLPVLVPAGAFVQKDSNVVVGREALQATGCRAGNCVAQTRYAEDRIFYEVALQQPALMIENETYFPGWEANIDRGGGPTRLRAKCVNGAFRGWLLPAGRYRMTATFRMPHFPILVLMSAGGWILWGGILLLGLRSIPRSAPRRSPRVANGDAPGLRGIFLKNAEVDGRFRPTWRRSAAELADWPTRGERNVDGSGWSRDLGLLFLALAAAFVVVDILFLPANGLIGFPVHHDDYTNLCTRFPSLRPPTVRPVSTLVIACLGRLGMFPFTMGLTVLTLLYAALVFLFLQRLLQFSIGLPGAFLAGTLLFSFPESLQWFKYTGLMTNLTSATLGILSLHLLLLGLERRRWAIPLSLGIVLFALSAFSKEDFFLPGLIVAVGFLARKDVDRRRALFLIGGLALLAGVALTFENRIAGSLFSGGAPSGVYRVSLSVPSVVQTTLRYLSASSYLTGLSTLLVVSVAVGIVVIPRWRTRLCWTFLLAISLIGPYALLPNHFFPYYAYAWAVWEVGIAAIVLAALLQACEPAWRIAGLVLLGLIACGAIAVTHEERRTAAAWYRSTGEVDRRMVQFLLDNRKAIDRESRVGVVGLTENCPWAVSTGAYLNRVLGFRNKWIVFVDADSILFTIDGPLSRFPGSFVEVRQSSEAASYGNMLFIAFDQKGNGALSRGFPTGQASLSRGESGGGGASGGSADFQVRSTRYAGLPRAAS